MAFDAAQPRKDPRLFFRARDHDRLLFWRKLQWKKFWTDQPPPAKRTCRSTIGVEREEQTARRHEEARLRMTRRRSWDTEGQAAGEEVTVTRSICFYHSKTNFFLGQQKFKAEHSFSMGPAWAIALEAMKLSRATGAKRKSWAERECPSNAGLDS